MLFKPSALLPDATAIDSTIANTFTFTNNGDALTHYRFKFYKNSDNSLLFDSTKLASTVGQYTLPANSGTLTNNIDVKYQVEVWSGSTSVLSDFVFLKTLSTPTMSMTVPASISARSYTFTASYSQAQNIPYSKYKFILYNGSDEILSDTGFLYGYSITHTLDGLDIGSYKIEAIAESSYGLIGTTGKKSFSVSYTEPDPASYLVTTPNDNTGGIELSWSPLIQVTGVSTGTISYVTGKFDQGVQINSGSKVTFNEEVPSEFSLNLWVKSPSGFVGDIVTLGNDEVKFGYSGLQFYLNVNGVIAYSKPLSLPSDFFKVCIKSDLVIIESASYVEYL